MSHHSPAANYDPVNDEEYEEKMISRSLPLEEHLLQQLRLEFNNTLDLKVGEMIIGNLDERGYLSCDLEDIAKELKISHLEDVQKVLKIIQHFEPLGIAARNLKECLLAQVRYRFNGNSEILIKVINNFLDAIGRKKFDEVAKALQISPEEVKNIAKLISSLEPTPARNHCPIDANIYIKPDILVSEDAHGNLKAISSRENIPTLKISRLYKNMLNKPNISEEERTFILEKIKNAMTFIKSIEQRHQTLKNIAQFILDHQKGFFEIGPSVLKPLRLKDIAVAIERNESTVSRAISNKYMDTPQGIIAMKYFFSQGISKGSEDSISNQSIKEEIKSLIKSENVDKPLTDQDIYKHLANSGLSVARRTVSKYRQAMKILPAHLRKV